VAVEKTPRACIFCDNPLTGIRAKEHAIPRWLMEYLGITDDQLSSAVAQSVDNAILIDRKMDAASFVEGRVCENCNHGWMSDLETASIDLLKPLIDGERNILTLSNDERTTLAKWTTKTAYVISHAAPLQKTPDASHLRYMKDNAGAVPLRVEVFGQQSINTGDFRQIQRNQWPHLGEPLPNPAPPRGTYKIGFQFRCLLLLVAYWSDPKSIPMISASIQIPLWPINKLHITYHNQLPPLDMKNPMAPLDRFCSTLGVCDMDVFLTP
jgi:hypothetical protein